MEGCVDPILPGLTLPSKGSGFVSVSPPLVKNQNKNKDFTTDMEVGGPPEGTGVKRRGGSVAVGS